MSRAPVSLQRRLQWAASVLVVLALLLAALGLYRLFRAHAEREFDARLQRQLDDVTAALQVQTDAEGRAALGLRREPADPLFRQPASGLYWLALPASGQPLRSRSWWDSAPAFTPTPPADAPGAAPWVRTADGPRGEPLRVWLRRVQPAGWDGAVVLAVASDASALEAASRSFARGLGASLALLALLLVLASHAQVRLGLQPLRRLQGALAALRERHSPRLDGHHPAEVQPLVDEINRLLGQRQSLVDEAEAQAGNLAHALKTPLAVLGQLAQADGRDSGLGPEARALLREQLDAMERQIHRQLTRSRAAASVHSGGARAPLADVLPPLLRTLSRLHPDIDIAADEAQALPAPRITPHDLHEVLGNLLDNAARHARRRVQLSLQATDGGLALCVDDDGPGIAPEARTLALQRGARLDESHRGSGLGLAIVADLVEVYGGRFALEDGPLGGLRARLWLPLALSPAASAPPAAPPR